MKRKKNKPILLIIFLIVFSLGRSSCLYCEPTTLKQIVQEPDKFDSQFVKIEGEVIGEPLYAKGAVWINILSKGYHAALVVPQGYLGKIKHWGSYQESGDIVKVEGKFYKECPMHHEMHIHAQSLEVIALGAPRQDIVLASKVQTAVILFIICLVIGLIYLIKSRHGTRS